MVQENCSVFLEMTRLMLDGLKSYKTCVEDPGGEGDGYNDYF